MFLWMSLALMCISIIGAIYFEQKYVNEMSTDLSDKYYKKSNVAFVFFWIGCVLSVVTAILGI